MEKTTVAYVFITLIVVYLLSCVVAPIVIALMFPYLHIPSHIFDGLSLSVTIIVLIILIAALVIPAVGLIFWRSWSRTLFTLVFCLEWIWDIISIHYAVSGIDDVVNNLSYASQGAIIAIMWTSDIRYRFKNEKSRFKVF